MLIVKEKLDKINYPNNFLQNVIFRIDFAEVLKVSQEQPVKFQEEIRPTFPVLEKKKITEFKTTFQKGNKIDEKKDINIWEFFSENKTKKAILGPNFLAYEDNKHSNFPELKKIVGDLFYKFKNIYDPLVFNRIGFRYINHIELKQGDPFNWKGYLNPSLTAIVEKFFEDDDKKSLSRSMGQLNLKKEDYTIVFNYGIANSEFPSKISRKEFILDFDCYSQDINSSNVIEDYLVPFHYQILAFFEHCIGNELRKIMKGKK